MFGLTCACFNIDDGRTVAPSNGLIAATKVGTKVTSASNAANLNMAEYKAEVGWFLPLDVRLFISLAQSRH